MSMTVQPTLHEVAYLSLASFSFFSYLYECWFEEEVALFEITTYVH
jgi:hypothetical protein